MEYIKFFNNIFIRKGNRMKYSYYKNLNLSFKATEIKVNDVLREIGFGVLTEISINDAFKTKLNLEYKKYKIIGACNPPLAYNAIILDEMIGILMPCNILIIDNQDGTTKVVFPNAKNLLKITANKDIMTLAKKVDRLLEEAFNNIN